jgi:hypothetical protein
MRRPFVLLGLPLSTLALALAACGTAVSTAGFKGTQHEVAQTISNLQANATAGEQSKICADDLAAALVTKLGGKHGCEAAIKSQLAQVDSLEASVESVKIAADGQSATATVKSIHEGKSRASGVSLVKEGGKWKIAGI